MRRRYAPSRGAFWALIGWMIVVLVLGAGILLAGLAASASAQSGYGGNSTADNGTATGPPEGDHIDNSTILVSTSYDNSTGDNTVRVTLYSKTIQRVTLTDAGGVFNEGEVNQRSVTLSPRENTTIAIDTTRIETGFVGVTLATSDTLYAVPIQTSDDDSTMFGGTPGWGTVRIAAIGSGLGVLLALGLEGYRRRSGGRREVRQRA